MLKRLCLLASVFSALWAQKNGHTPSFWVPDHVVTKHDPYDLIASNFGQPNGEWNWNADSFTMMSRSQLTCNGCTEGGKHVFIENLTLFVNDAEFIVKAVAYAPIPLGVSTVIYDGSGGGGLCSSRRTPYHEDDYTSACTDSDFYDGSPSLDPEGPQNGWFSSLWARDFPVLKAAGCNTIRLYNTNPTTYQYTASVLAGNQTAIEGTIVAPPAGKDHVPFMNAAWDANLMVIYPLISDRDMLNNLPTDKFVRYIQNQIDEVGNHRALLMFALGNELDLEQHPDMLVKVNYYIQWARNYTMAKWGRVIPFIDAVRDSPSHYDQLYDLLECDIFATNSGYRGPSFWALWDGDGGNSGLGPLSRRHNKPNFIGEIGWHQINGSQTKDQPGWFNQLWKEMLQTGIPNGCIGGTFFEYMDEPYTKNDIMEKSMGMVSAIVAVEGDPMPTWQYPNKGDYTVSGPSIYTTHTFATQRTSAATGTSQSQVSETTGSASAPSNSAPPANSASSATSATPTSATSTTPNSATRTASPTTGAAPTSQEGSNQQSDVTRDSQTLSVEASGSAQISDQACDGSDLNLEDSSSSLIHFSLVVLTLPFLLYI